jgi:hypothetical protein
METLCRNAAAFVKEGELVPRAERADRAVQLQVVSGVSGGRVTGVRSSRESRSHGSTTARFTKPIGVKLGQVPLCPAPRDSNPCASRHKPRNSHDSHGGPATITGASSRHRSLAAMRLECEPGTKGNAVNENATLRIPEVVFPIHKACRCKSRSGLPVPHYFLTQVNCIAGQ